MDKGPSLRRAPTLHLPDQWEIADPSSFTQARSPVVSPLALGIGQAGSSSRLSCGVPMGIPKAFTTANGGGLGCGAARRQASDAPDQLRTAPRRLQGVAGHSGARGLQALVGPEPVGNSQTPNLEATWSPPAMQLRAWRPLQSKGLPQKREGPPPHTSTPRRPPKMARKSDLDKVVSSVCEGVSLAQQRNHRLRRHGGSRHHHCRPGCTIHPTGFCSQGCLNGFA